MGKCILFKNRWVTPNEFQAISGRKSSKDWKRSIRLKGRCLKEFIAQGLFQEHAKSCACKVCSGEDVEMLKQEGEMALAAKRRRLSQADSHTIIPEPYAAILPPTASLPVFEKPEQPQPLLPPLRPPIQQKRPKKQETEVEKDEPSPKPQKIWSPSGGTRPCIYQTNRYQCIYKLYKLPQIFTPSCEQVVFLLFFFLSLEVAHQEEGSSNDNEDEYMPDSDSQGDVQLKGVVGE